MLVGQKINDERAPEQKVPPNIRFIETFTKHSHTPPSLRFFRSDNDKLLATFYFPRDGFGAHTIIDGYATMDEISSILTMLVHENMIIFRELNKNHMGL